MKCLNAVKRVAEVLEQAVGKMQEVFGYVNAWSRRGKRANARIRIGCILRNEFRLSEMEVQMVTFLVLQTESADCQRSRVQCSVWYCTMVAMPALASRSHHHHYRWGYQSPFV